MSAAPRDPDRLAATDPRTPPDRLADIAARRWDLHALILAHPQAYPALRLWIAQIDPGSVRPARPAPQQPSPAQHPGQPQQPFPQQPTPRHPAPQQTSPSPRPAYPGPQQSFPPRQPGPPHPGPYRAGLAGGPPPRPRGRGGCAIAGCGVVAAVVLLFVVLAAIGGLGDALSGHDDPPPVAAPTSAAPSSVVEESLKAYEKERARYDELRAELDGNPVAPLLPGSYFMDRLEQEAAAPDISEFTARSIAHQAQHYRKELEKLVKAAAKRRTNESGTLTERLVDKAGDGFIDVRWDAASACDPSESSDQVTTGCVRGSDPLVVHLQAESEMSGDWERRMLVAHELAHVYQRADRSRFDDNTGTADRLVEQGLFQGSSEKMADCYALTYYDQPDLSDGQVRMGYGYVCNASERQAIREWAAEIDAPMR